MSNIVLRSLMFTMMFGMVHAGFAQLPAPPATLSGATPVGEGMADLSLVGRLEGRRVWVASFNRQQTTAGIKIEEVKIENGKGTGLLTGYAATGYAGTGRCSSVFDVRADLTLDANGVLTIVADSGTCGIWEYTLHRDTPTHFKGRHRVNPTDIELDFTPR